MSGEALQVLLGDLESLAQRTPTQRAEQMAHVFFAPKLKQILDEIIKNANEALIAGSGGEKFIETSTGWVGEIRSSTRTTKWRNDELRTALANDLVYFEDGECRTAEELAFLLWDEDDGLQPLNGAMRKSVLRDIWGYQLDEFCETDTTKKVTILASPDE